MTKNEADRAVGEAMDRCLARIMQALRPAEEALSAADEVGVYVGPFHISPYNGCSSVDATDRRPETMADIMRLARREAAHIVRKCAAKCAAAEKEAADLVAAYDAVV